MNAGIRDTSPTHQYISLTGTVLFFRWCESTFSQWLEQCRPYLSLNAWTKKCRKCGKLYHASQFKRQKTTPGQLPLCEYCAGEERLEEEEARYDHLNYGGTK